MNQQVSLLSLLYEATTAFDLKTFVKLSTLKERRTYLRSIGAIFLGEGIDRETYDIGGGKALKLLTTGRTHTHQQKFEVDASKCLGNTKLFTKVLDYDKENYQWLIVEKADEVFSNDKSGERNFIDELNRTLGFLPFPELRINESYELHDLVLEAQNKEPEIEPELSEKRWNYLLDHPSNWFNNLLALVEKCRIDSIDFHAGNFGMRNGRLVVIDYGFDQED